MAGNGQITRKDIITDEAIGWGKEYANVVNEAIAVNNSFIQTIVTLNAENIKLRKSENQVEYLKQKNELKIATDKVNLSIEEQKKLEIALEKIRQEKLKTEKLEIDALNKKQAAQKTNNKLSIEEKLLLQEQTAETKRQIIANGALGNAYKQLSAKVAIAANAVKNIRAEGKLASETQAQYNKRLSQAQKEFDKLNARVRSADAAVGQFNRNVGNYPKQAAEGLRNLISAFGVLTGISLFAKLMTEAFTVTRNFQKEIVNLAAIAGKTREDIAPLEQKIREVSKSSINGATDVAKLATELIKLGSTTEEAEKLLEPVNNLSVALQATAEDSATLVKSILNAYGEGADEAGRVTDILAESANRSALDFQGLRDSFSYLAPAARALDIPISKTAAIIGTLADNGIKAESAGRLTSTAFARLANQGLTLDDALRKINEAQKDGTSQLEVLSLASKLFGAEAGKIGLILANNTEKIEESTIAYENSGGALKELTDKQLKSLDAELKILSSSWEDYILDTDASTNSTLSLTSGIRFLSTNLKTIINVLFIIGAAWVAYKAALIIANVQTKLIAINTQIAAASQLRNAIATGTATKAQLANASATNLATISWQRFSAVLKANALFLILSSLIAAVYYIDKLNKSLSEMTKETISNTNSFLKNREQISKNNESISTLSDRYDVLKSKSKLTKEEQKELDEILKILSKTVPDAVTEVDKYGDALSINTKKTREFIIANQELNKLENTKKLKENIDLYKKLRNEQRGLTISEEDLNSKYIEGLGFVRKRNGQLEIYNKILGTSRDLTLDEQILFKKKVLNNEKNISITESNIKALRGLTDSEKAAAKAAEEKSNSDVKNGARTIAIIDAEIKAQEDLISSLSDKTGRQGNAIKAKIAALKAERELIFSTEKAENSKFDNGLKGYKKVSDAIYQLSQFRYQNEIDNNQKIIDSDNETTENKLEALNQIRQLQEAKNEETIENELRNNLFSKEDLDKLSKSKLEIYKRDAENRIKSLLDGKIEQENISNEEKLILEKYYAEKKNLEEKDAKRKQDLIDAEVASIQKSIDAQLQLQENSLNQELVGENSRYRQELEDAEGNFRLIEQARDKHERELLKIQNKYALQGTKLQIASLEKVLADNDTKEEKDRISAEKRAQIVADLERFKKEQSDLETGNYIKNLITKEELEQQAKNRISELSQELAYSLIDLSNTIFGANISNIDNEIAYWEDYYNNQLEMAGNDAEQKKAIEAELEKKRKALERDRRKEEYKAAVVAKIMAGAQIGIDLARTLSAIQLAAAQLDAISFGTAGTPYRILQTTLAIGTASAQAAAVALTPLPKYEEGTKGKPHKGGPAIVGEVRPEVIIEPGKKPYIVDVPSVLNLARGTEVIPSIDEYEKIKRASIMASIQIQGKKMDQVTSSKTFDNAYSKEIVDELKKNTEAVKRNKANIHIQNNIDIGYEIWKMCNTKWH